MDGQLLTCICWQKSETHLLRSLSCVALSRVFQSIKITLTASSLGFFFSWLGDHKCVIKNLCYKLSIWKLKYVHQITSDVIKLHHGNCRNEHFCTLTQTRARRSRCLSIHFLHFDPSCCFSINSFQRFVWNPSFVHFFQMVYTHISILAVCPPPNSTQKKLAAG